MGLFSLGMLPLQVAMAAAAAAFAPDAFFASPRRTPKPMVSSHRAPPRASRTPRFQSRGGNDDDLFLLSIDGTLASTRRSKSWVAICVALRVWPSIRSDMEALGLDADLFAWECDRDSISKRVQEGDEPHEWLLQKLSALSSITQQGNSPDAMLGCDSVLLARILIEEQLLDGGRSNGRGGKYGSKFHPSVSSADGKGDGSKVGSRPLTVGELYANWPELRDVARMKYPFIEESLGGKPERQDPLPVIRKYMNDVQSNITSSWRSVAYDILYDYGSRTENVNLRQNTMILLGHQSQIPWALTSLQSLGCELNLESDLEAATPCPISADNPIDSSMKVFVTTSDKACERLLHHKSNLEDEESFTGNQLLLIVPNARETHSEMIERIIFDNHGYSESQGGNMFVIHSSLEVLKQCKSFLGEDAPMISNGLRKCIQPQTNDAVTLFLPQWSDNVHPTEENDGEMDPWLNLVTEEQILDLVSAKFTAPLA